MAKLYTVSFHLKNKEVTVEEGTTILLTLPVKQDEEDNV